ncbi:MAG: hypothetical protein QOH05_1611 [Acetobacteraceae bacterium]|jgi:hypothetical protein|nr:hypothetical protein [Acetobacteraceae bacterium]
MPTPPRLLLKAPADLGTFADARVSTLRRALATQLRRSHRLLPHCRTLSFRQGRRIVELIAQRPNVVAMHGELRFEIVDPP